jgi:3-hydroxyisobutyrate dehydrogenase
MGRPMAARLVGAGLAVAAFDPVERTGPPGVELAPSVAAVAERSELILLSLPGPSAVEAVLLGERGILVAPPAGLAAVADTSTSSPSLARRVAAAGAARGVAVIDCPVSGGPQRAAEGSLAMMVGGTEEAVAASRPVLRHVAAQITHVGPPGAGQLVKLANNLMTACNMAAVAESVALASNAGVAPHKLFDVLTSSTGDSSVLRRRFPIAGVVPEAPVNDDYAPLFSLDLMRKDLRLALDAVADAGLDAPLTARALELYDRAAAAGWDHLDYSVIARLAAGGEDART